jgi:hypothetical protein
MPYRAFMLWRISGSKFTKRPLKCNHNFFLQFITYPHPSDSWIANPATKKKVGNIFTVSLFYLDPKVIFHTNDVTHDSSRGHSSRDVFPGPSSQKQLKLSHIFILQFILYLQQWDMRTANPAMKDFSDLFLHSNIYFSFMWLPNNLRCEWS